MDDRNSSWDEELELEDSSFDLDNLDDVVEHREWLESQTKPREEGVGFVEDLEARLGRILEDQEIQDTLDKLDEDLIDPIDLAEEYLE